MSIIKIYSQEIPETRFIGKKYGDTDRAGGSFGAKWQEAFASGLFDTIEKSAFNGSPYEFFQDSGAYIGLMRCCKNEPFQYWIGMFTPAGTVVPDGFDYADFPASRFGIGWIYGDESKGELYCHEPDVAKELEKSGMILQNDDNGACWSFERYQCPRYTTPDDKGCVILDIGFFIVSQ